MIEVENESQIFFHKNIKQHKLEMSNSKEINKVKEQELQKLFIFNHVFNQVSDGIAFVIARNKQEAIENIVKIAVKNEKDQHFDFNSWDSTNYHNNEYKGRKFDYVVCSGGFYVEWPEGPGTNEENLEVLQWLVRKELEACKNVQVLPLANGPGGFCGGGD